MKFVTAVVLWLADAAQPAVALLAMALVAAGLAAMFGLSVEDLSRLLPSS